MNAKRFAMVLILLVLSLATAEAALQCQTRQNNCNAGEVDVFQYSSQGAGGEHASIDGSYENHVCCSGVDGLAAGENSCVVTDGSSVGVLSVHDYTNSHAAYVGRESSYDHSTCLAVPFGETIDCQFVNRECGAGETCLAKASGYSNAHVASCSETDTGFPLSICCKTGSLIPDVCPYDCGLNGECVEECEIDPLCVPDEDCCPLENCETDGICNLDCELDYRCPDDAVDCADDDVSPTVAVDVTPNNPLTEDNLTCTYTASNPDGDPLEITLEWFKDGTLFGDPQIGMNPITPEDIQSSATSNGEEWKCEVTVSDGTNTDTASDEVTIGETPPVPVEGDVFRVSISLEPRAVPKGGTTEITVMVYNYSSESQVAVINLRADADVLGFDESNRVETIAAGGNITFTAHGTVNDTAEIYNQYKVYAVVDAIPGESNINNNSDDERFSVSQEITPISVPDISLMLVPIIGLIVLLILYRGK